MSKIVAFSGKEQFDPDRYLKTGSSAVLAFTKIIEAIPPVFGIISLVFASEKIGALTSSLNEALSQTMNFMLPEKVVSALSALLRFPLLIPFIALSLIVLDGIGVLLMRHSSLGDSLVILVHTVYWLLCVAGIILLIILVLRFASAVNRDVPDEISVVTGFLGAFAVIYFFLLLFILLFWSGYHHDIRVVVKAVRKERWTRKPANVGRNHLAGRAGWIAFGYGLELALMLLLIFYPLAAEELPVNIDGVKELWNISGSVFFIILAAESAFSFVKYLSLRICMRNFKKERS